MLGKWPLRSQYTLVISKDNPSTSEPGHLWLGLWKSQESWETSVSSSPAQATLDKKPALWMWLFWVNYLIFCSWKLFQWKQNKVSHSKFPHLTISDPTFYIQNSKGEMAFLKATLQSHQRFSFLIRWHRGKNYLCIEVFNSCKSFPRIVLSGCFSMNKTGFATDLLASIPQVWWERRIINPMAEYNLDFQLIFLASSLIFIDKHYLLEAHVNETFRIISLSRNFGL